MALKLMTRFLLLIGSVFLFSAATAHADPVEEALARFTEDYANDPSAVSITFGIEVEGRRWHVVSQAREGGGAAVSLRPGFPQTPSFYFTASAETLGKIDRGEWSGLTAMAAAWSDELTPLDVMFMDGYQRPADYDAMLRPLLFHFWTRGLPEIAPLGLENTRIVHGAPGVVMYYAEDLRSAVYHIPAGLGRDQAPTMTIPFPRLLVTLDGVMTGTVGGEPFILPAGHMVMIPPNIPAQVWNDGAEPMAMMFLMFGDGA